MENIWDENLDELNAPELSNNEPIDWDFQAEPDHRIVNKHTILVYNFFEKNLPIHELNGMMNGNVAIIDTPPAQYNRHITSIPISEWKALQIAHLRGKIKSTTTVFEDPEKFYAYNTIGVIISQKATDCFRVLPRKNSGDLCTIYIGKRFGIFEVKGNNFHFNWMKWGNVPAADHA